MWHAFDLMSAEHLAVADGLRAAAAPRGTPCRLVYGDRVLARFPTKDKIGTDKQWRPAIDRLPGITLIRHITSGDQWALDVEQRWQFASVDHHLTAKLTAGTSDWRPPRRWTFRQAMTPSAEGPPLTPLDESGAWEAGQVRRTCRAGEGNESATRAAPTLTSFYALLADFPLELARRGGKVEGLLGEGFTFSPSATLGPGDAASRAFPLARGLENYRLDVVAAGLPFEFWVNDSGLVVFACQGPTRALVLEKVEAVS